MRRSFTAEQQEKEESYTSKMSQLTAQLQQLDAVVSQVLTALRHLILTCSSHRALHCTVKLKAWMMGCCTLFELEGWSKLVRKEYCNVKVIRKTKSEGLIGR